MVFGVSLAPPKPHNTKQNINKPKAPKTKVEHGSAGYFAREIVKPYFLMGTILLSTFGPTVGQSSGPQSLMVSCEIEPNSIQNVSCFYLFVFNCSFKVLWV